MRGDLVGLERLIVPLRLVEDPSVRLALDPVAEVVQRARLLGADTTVVSSTWRSKSS